MARGGQTANRAYDAYDPREPRDEIGRWTSGAGVQISPSSERAFDGSAKEQKRPLSKLETGELAEKIALAWLRENGFANVQPTNAKITNYPVDIKHAGGVVEVKGGRVSNGAAAQQWRITLGQPGKAENKRLQSMSKEEKAIHNRSKMEAAVSRKMAAVNHISQEVGRPASAHTLSLIIDHDKQMADIHLFDGFHPRVAWRSKAAKAGYQGSIKYMADNTKKKTIQDQALYDENHHERDLDEAAADWPKDGRVHRTKHPEFDQELEEYAQALERELIEHMSGEKKS